MGVAGHVTVSVGVVRSCDCWCVWVWSGHVTVGVGVVRPCEFVSVGVVRSCEFVVSVGVVRSCEFVSVGVVSSCEFVSVCVCPMRVSVLLIPCSNSSAGVSQLCVPRKLTIL